MDEPQPSAGTVRQRIGELLSRSEMDVRQLSQQLGVKEKEIVGHLSHLARSVQTRGQKLLIGPCRCLSCGYEFKERRRFTRPGRCPRCRRTHLSAPGFRIVGPPLR
jgi:predicted Zn-ribbon and HTH transcriptional regulator